MRRNPREQLQRCALREIARTVGPGYSGFGSAGDGPVVGYRTRERPHSQPNPMVAAAQLRVADIPDLPRPGGADMLQVLWCPDHHAVRPVGPAVALRWRREADVSGPFADPPRSRIGRDDLVPVPCRLYPEQVLEYPFPQELPAGLAERVDAWDERVDEDEDGMSYVRGHGAGVKGWRLRELEPDGPARDAVPAMHRADLPGARHRLEGIRRRHAEAVAARERSPAGRGAATD